MSIKPATVLRATTTNAYLGGAVTLLAGSNIVISQSGQNITIASTASGGGVTSVSNSDGSLTISPTTGAVVGKINLGHTNTWTTTQDFTAGATGTIFDASEQFNINGEFFGDQDTTNFNLRLGKDTLAAIGGGTYNLGIGLGVMAILGDGTYNVALGNSIFSAMQSASNTNNLGIGNIIATTSDNISGSIFLGSYLGTGLESTNQSILIGTSIFTFDDASDSDTDIIIGINIGSTTQGYSGSNNVIIGSGFGINSTAKIFSSNNLLLGNNVGTNLTLGGGNVGIGDSSLYSNTEGATNFAIGAFSLYSNTLGNENFALGYKALFASVTTSGSLGIGNHVLEESTGNGQFAIGNDALRYNFGNNNTAVGNAALRGTTLVSSGEGNSAFGAGAIGVLTTGVSNGGFGAGVLGAITSGSLNVAFGDSALASSATSESCVAIGYSAGLNLTAGDQCIVIGSRNYFPSTTASGQLVIGNFIYGKGLTGVDLSISPGLIGFGVQSPTATLHLQAGTTSALSAPIKFTSGTSMTTPEAGAVEYDGKDLFFTPTGTIRKTIPTVITGRSTAQTAAVTSVATQTVGASDATYQVSANVLVTTATAHSFTVTCAYTDEGNTARTVTMNFSTLAGVISNAAITNVGGAVPYEGIPLHIRCKSGTTITVATTGTFTTVVYNVESSISKIA